MVHILYLLVLALQVLLLLLLFFFLLFSIFFFPCIVFNFNFLSVLSLNRSILYILFLVTFCILVLTLHAYDIYNNVLSFLVLLLIYILSCYMVFSRCFCIIFFFYFFTNLIMSVGFLFLYFFVTNLL